MKLNLLKSFIVLYRPTEWRPHKTDQVTKNRTLFRIDSKYSEIWFVIDFFFRFSRDVLRIGSKLFQLCVDIIQLLKSFTISSIIQTKLFKFIVLMWNSRLRVQTEQSLPLINKNYVRIAYHTVTNNGFASAKSWLVNLGSIAIFVLIIASCCNGLECSNIFLNSFTYIEVKTWFKMHY